MCSAIPMTYVGLSEDGGFLIAKPVLPQGRPEGFEPSFDDAWKIYVQMCDANARAACKVPGPTADVVAAIEDRVHAQYAARVTVVSSTLQAAAEAAAAAARSAAECAGRNQTRALRAEAKCKVLEEKLGDFQGKYYKADDALQMLRAGGLLPRLPRPCPPMSHRRTEADQRVCVCVCVCVCVRACN